MITVPTSQGYEEDYKRIHVQRLREYLENSDWESLAAIIIGNN